MQIAKLEVLHRDEQMAGGFEPSVRLDKAMFILC
jgi:hypothetical protein